MAPGVGRAQAEGDQADHSECSPAIVFVHVQIVRVSLSLIGAPLFGVIVAKAARGGFKISFATREIGCRFLGSRLQIGQVRGTVTTAERSKMKGNVLGPIGGQRS